MSALAASYVAAGLSPHHVSSIDAVTAGTQTLPMFQSQTSVPHAVPLAMQSTSLTHDVAASCAPAGTDHDDANAGATTTASKKEFHFMRLSPRECRPHAR